MKAIRQRLYVLSLLSSIELLVFVLLIVKNTLIVYLNISFFVVLVFLLSILPIGLLIREYKKYAFAKLIIENKIIHIKTIETEQELKKLDFIAIPTGISDIFISCFGILLGSKVIKFNTEGISLKKVEISHDYILIAYGKGKKCDTIKLLHGIIGEQELQNIVEQFRHETGIIPNVIN